MDLFGAAMPHRELQAASISPTSTGAFGRLDCWAVNSNSHGDSGKNRKRLILAGIATFVIGLIITFPARVAYQWFAPGELKLSGINGSIWRGNAAQGTAGGIYLADVNWSFRPLGLLGGKLEFASNGKLASGFFDANVAVGMGGSLALSNVTGALTLDTLAEVLPLAGIEGDISVQFEELIVENGLPVEATGTLNIANLVSRYLSPSIPACGRPSASTVGKFLESTRQ